MKKSIQLLISLLLFSIAAKSQITKRNWMIGGNANFSFENNESNGTNGSKRTSINLSPNIGYFFH